VRRWAAELAFLRLAWVVVRRHLLAVQSSLAQHCGAVPGPAMAAAHLQGVPRRRQLGERRETLRRPDGICRGSTPPESGGAG
jgi:hypothetical protein